VRLLFREALLSFRRAPLLSGLSVTTIAFSLFTLGLFLLVAVNLREALKGLEERVEIVAFVLRGTPPETITLASQDIAVFPEVQAVDYITEEQALARARKELVEFRDAYRDLSVNPLPASFEIRLKDGYRNAAAAERVAKRLEGFSFVEDIRYGRDWVERLDKLRNLAGIVGLVIGAAFAAVAVVIIGVTIRLTIMQRAREISIMRLVGATNRFIRRRAQGPARRTAIARSVLCRLPIVSRQQPGHARRPDLLRTRTDGHAGGLWRAPRPVRQPGERGSAFEKGVTCGEREKGRKREKGDGGARRCGSPSPFPRFSFSSSSPFLPLYPLNTASLNSSKRVSDAWKRSRPSAIGCSSSGRDSRDRSTTSTTS
jgi:cell division transport system permease protein